MSQPKYKYLVEYCSSAQWFGEVEIEANDHDHAVDVFNKDPGYGCTLYPCVYDLEGIGSLVRSTDHDLETYR